MRILLVEDDLGITELIREIFEQNEYTSCSVQSGKEALKYLNEKSPDLLLLDYSLPDMNGKEFLEELILNKISIPPFIVSTGQGDEQIAVQMMKFGARDYLIKDSHYLDRVPEVIKRVVKELKNESKLKKAEDELKLQSRIVENMAEGVLLINENENIFYTNPTFDKLFGYDQGELINKPITNIISVDEKQRQSVMEGIKNTIVKELIWTGEFICIKKDGSKFWCQTNISNFHHAEEGPVWIVALSDITSKKIAERTVLENNRLTAIGEIASSVAHDFNNSLQTMLGNLELALINNELPVNVKKYLENIKTAVIDSSSRVQLLQRIGGKKQSASEYVPINLINIVNEVIEQSRPLWKDNAEKHGLSIAVNTDITKLPKVLGNAGELRTVFFNIIKNSIEAMPGGGSININSSQKEDTVIISISDTGMGMDEETSVRLFQPFYSTKGFEQGRGLGMSGAKSIITEHGGIINVVSSIPGNGTTIQVILPATEVNESDQEKVPVKENSSIKILWVDDERMIRDMAIDMLDSMGYKGDVVSSGEDALKALSQNEYQLVITDIGMPGMNGWQVASKIHELYDGKIKVGLLSGWGAQVEEKELHDHKIKHVLAKPFKIYQLRQFINDIISNNNS